MRQPVPNAATSESPGPVVLRQRGVAPGSSQARGGQYDEAINTFKDMAQRKDGPLPIDGILMPLGRTYLEAGQRADAQQTFNRLGEEYPDSRFTADAWNEREILKKTWSAGRGGRSIAAMTPQHDGSNSRRQFLRFLAASPYVAALGGVAAFLEERPLGQAAQTGAADILSSPADALNVLDFEETARRKVMPGHWAYMASGVDFDATLRANREGYSHVQLRPRRLRDATRVDMRVDLFGTSYASPIFLCPTAAHKAFQSDGEIAVARAAKARNTLQILSTVSSTPIEDVNQALGRPCWYQLYAPRSWEANEVLLKRVEAAGTSVIALTVDNTTGRNSETYLRTRPKDLKQCNACHENGPGSGPRPMTDNLTMPGGRGTNPAMDWSFVDRLRRGWKGTLIVKGIETHEDARLCVEHGADAILVSNHGGRATETGRATIEALPEVVGEVAGRIPVFLDGGIRRGTDVFKALALGAKAVGVGRPYLWGLGAFGQAGVDRVLEILQGELKLAMGNCGTATVADITRTYVATPDWRS